MVRVRAEEFEDSPAPEVSPARPSANELPVDPRCKASLWRDGKNVHLGYFTTAEEAALHVARTLEAKASATLPPPMAAAEARTLQVAEEQPAEEGVRRCNVEAVQVEAMGWRKEGGGAVESGMEAESGVAHAPAEQHAGREPVVRYRLGGKRLSSGHLLSEEETGGLDTAGLDPEQRDMLAQMQRAQALLEQDMERLEQQRAERYGWPRTAPTGTSPQPQPQV